MSQLERDLACDPFYQWLVKHRLEFLHKKLVSEGFENVQDFQGMNENKLLELWNKIGNNKIGVENRFIKSIKDICLKPITVVTDKENTILSNLKQTIKKYQSILQTYKTFLLVLIVFVNTYTILDINKIHEVQLKAIRQDFEKIRQAVNQRETALITSLNENYKNRGKYVKKQMKLLNSIITHSTKTYNDCYNSFQQTNLEDDNLIQTNETRKNLIQSCDKLVNQFILDEKDGKWKSNDEIETLKYNGDDGLLFYVIDQHGTIEYNLVLPTPIITNITELDQDYDKNTLKIKLEWKLNGEIDKLLKRHHYYRMLPMWQCCNDNNSKQNKNDLIVLPMQKCHPYKNECECNIKIPDIDIMDEKESKTNNSNCNTDRDLQYNMSFKCQLQLLTFLDPKYGVEIESPMSEMKQIKVNIRREFEYKCTFKTLSCWGRNGPTKINVQGRYSNQDNKNDTTIDELQQGMQLWTVPQTGNWNIVCYGAQGGDSGDLKGGKGAMVGGIIKLFKNDIIKIACGQMGGGCVPSGGAGGGGGTFFILYKSGRNNPTYKNGAILNIALIIAAGGNGACDCRKYKMNGVDGLCVMNEKRDNYVSSGRASRGASFKNDFDIFKSYNSAGDSWFGGKDYNKGNPKSFLNGAIGGKPIDSYGGYGGFGGGGAGYIEGGGGGGYIGGLVSKQDEKNKDLKKYSSYGALSYNCCKDNKIMKSGCSTTNGKIEVAFVILH